MIKIEKIREELQSLLSGFRKLVICGIGNEIKGDDFAGSKIAQILSIRLQNMESRVRVFDCKEAPESFLEKIVAEKPTHILIIDAAFLNEYPGKVKILRIEDIEEYTASTHNVPITILIKYISERLGYLPKVIVIGIQPKSLELGDPVSKDVKHSIEIVTNMIEEVIMKCLTQK
ncbi:MAG: hydrogenase maturation peptidase HycI [Candidatus Asgardarchaeia archaeon]